jgi:plastocyanin
MCISIRRLGSLEKVQSAFRHERSEAMNLMRISVRFVWLLALATIGCASHPPFPDASLTGKMVEVQIGESLTPREITAKPGDEVRWVNSTSDSVDISFVEPLDNRVSCQKGFVSAGWGYLFGGGSAQPESLVVATVHSSKYASLCFSAPGTYAYTIKRETTEKSKEHGIAGTVTIE